MEKTIVSTNKAPQAIGTYSQAIKVDRTVYLSGQIPLDPQTMQIVGTEVDVQVRRVFDNLKAVAEAAGGNFGHIVKLNIYLTDLSCFPQVNEIMAEHFDQPYPARAVIGVASLPKSAAVEMDAIMQLD